MSERLEFAIQQRKDHPHSPSIRSEIPLYVRYGERLDIAEGVVFAPHGFGYEFIDTKLELIPHAGGIWIGNDVSVHELTVICPATVAGEDTKIEHGTKIDTRCHIAHNVHIGQNCLITSGVTIGGSTVIKDNVYIGIGAVIRNKVTIGEGATIGMGAVVTKDVPPGETWFGNPAQKQDDKLTVHDILKGICDAHNCTYGLEAHGNGCATIHIRHGNGEETSFKVADEGLRDKDGLTKMISDTTP